MSEPSSDTSAGRRRFQFSIATLLLLTTVVALSITLALTWIKLSRSERELESQRPMSADEVARQFEAATTLGSIKTKVDDVRYSPAKDAFKVEFSWTDSKVGNSWSTSVTLESDGYGLYLGQIRNPEFLRPFGARDSFIVHVATPSALKPR